MGVTMFQDRMTLDQRIALESVAQALSTVNRMRELDDEGFDLAMARAERIEAFIRKRDDVDRPSGHYPDCGPGCAKVGA